MRHSLLHTLGNAVWVARAERRRALPLLAAYGRLKAGELAAARVSDARPRRTTILGMPVFFHDHYWLLDMYEEIFLRRQYEFESDSPAPAIVDAGSNTPGLQAGRFQIVLVHAHRKAGPYAPR